MNKSVVLNIARIALTLLWRLAFTAAAVAALCAVGLVMVLNMIFTGPSETARDTLALTLLESERTCDIPAYFLGEDYVARINTGMNTAVGTSDPHRILPGTDDPTEWPEWSLPGGVRSETVQSDSYIARILLIRSDAPVQFFRDPTAYAPGDHVIYARNTKNISCYAGFLDNGVLMLTDDPYQLLDGNSAVIACGPVLILNGQINEALLSGASGVAPRAAIGQRADGTVIFVTADGWTREHPGAQYRDLINIMSEYGAVNACILHRNTTYSCWMMDTASDGANEE